MNADKYQSIFLTVWSRGEETRDMKGRRGGEVGKEGEGREGDGKNTIENIPCSSQSTA